MTHTPNLEAAATAAAETLIKYNVSSAPVTPLPILKKLPNVLILSFTEFASEIGVERGELLDKSDSKNKDAFTVCKEVHGQLRYFVGYNMLLPDYLLQRALARELGHIVLGHDGTRTEEARMMEAMFFARHFLCPRPLIKAIQDLDIPITVETLGLITGCYERCLIGMQKSHGVHIPAELNRKIREQFANYIQNFADCKSIIVSNDESILVNFGTFMEGYEE